MQFSELYSNTSKLISQNLNLSNMNISKVILNRVIFIIYCEKLNILPENTLKNNLSSIKLNKLFHYIHNNVTPFSSLFSENLSNYYINDSEIFNNFLKFYNFDLNFDIISQTFSENISDDKTKHKGVFYTPEFITDYISKNTILPYLSLSNKAETVWELIDEYDDIDILYDKLIDFKIIDPSCGSGAFLIKAVDILFEIYSSLSCTVSEALNNILNNIYGIDLDSESVELTKLVLFLKVKSYDKEFSPKNFNVKCGNSLIDDGDVCDSPFIWNIKFDIVFGNPPYVNIYKISSNKGEVDYYKKNYISAFKKFDLYVLFLEKGLKLLKENGVLGYIIPSNFLNQPYGFKIRKLLLSKTRIYKITDLTNFKIFKNASNSLILLFFINSFSKDNLITIEFPDDIYLNGNKNEVFIPQDIYTDFNDFQIRLKVNRNNLEIINKIQDKSISIDEICHVSAGIRSIPQSKFHSFEKYDSNSKRLIVGKDILNYHINYKGLWLNYLPDNLFNSMSPELFENDKIVIRDILSNNHFLIAYDYNHYYTSHTTSICLLKHQLPDLYSDEECELSKNFNLKYVFGFLTSKVVEFYFKLFISSEIHIYVNDIRRLPIVQIPLDYQEEFTYIVDELLNLNDNFYREINSFYRFLNKDKLSRKLQKYYLLDVSAFKSELKKINLPLSSDILKEFLKSVSHVNHLISEINYFESQLNVMIYELYEFSDNEIQIIEEFINSN